MEKFYEVKYVISHPPGVFLFIVQLPSSAGASASVERTNRTERTNDTQTTVRRGSTIHTNRTMRAM